jgi:hypothetical protein
MPTPPKRRGPRGPAKHKTLRIRSSDLELARYYDAATVLNLTTATWARAVLRENAVRILHAAGKTTAM